MGSWRGSVAWLASVGMIACGIQPPAGEPITWNEYGYTNASRCVTDCETAYGRTDENMDDACRGRCRRAVAEERDRQKVREEDARRIAAERASVEAAKAEERARADVKVVEEQRAADRKAMLDESCARDRHDRWQHQVDREAAEARAVAEADAERKRAARARPLAPPVDEDGEPIVFSAGDPSRIARLSMVSEKPTWDARDTECAQSDIEAADRGEARPSPTPVLAPTSSPKPPPTRPTPMQPAAPRHGDLVDDSQPPPAPRPTPPRSDGGGGTLMCCDGSPSPTCACPGHRGCCSHHGGVCGCR